MPDDRDTKPPPGARPATRPGGARIDPRREVARVALKPMRERAASDSGLGEEQAQREEKLMQALAQVEGRLLLQIAEAKDKAEEAKSSVRPHVAIEGERGQKGEPGKPASLASSLPAILMALAALVTAAGAFTRKDSDESEKVYTTLREVVMKQSEEQAKTRKDLDDLRSWIAGYLKATGVKVPDPPGVEPVPALDLAPTPLVKSGTARTASGAPAIQVRDPLPAPAASVAPVQLPPPEKLFPKAP